MYLATVAPQSATILSVFRVLNAFEQDVSARVDKEAEMPQVGYDIIFQLIL